MTNVSLAWLRDRTSVIALLGVLTLAGCGEQNEIDALKNSKLDLCPGISMGTLVESFIKQAQWETVNSADGARQVNITGYVAVDGQQARTRMEFPLDPATGSQRFGTLKIDGERQEDDVAAEFLSAMCSAAGGGPGD